MAYTHTQYEQRVVHEVSLATTGDKGKLTPGYVPLIIRAVAVVCKADPTAAGVVKIDKRPTAGSDTGRGDGDIAVINIAATHSQGDVVYKDGLNVELRPGEEAVVDVTSAVTGLTSADVIFLVEPRWEVPGNISALKESA